MTLELLGRLGALAAGGGLAVLVLAHPRLARLAGLALLAAGMAALAPLLVPEGQGRVVAAVAPVLLAAGAGLAFLFRRQPWALAILALAAAPARVAVDVGDESASLLLPLYAVLAGGAIELAWRLWRGKDGARELGRASWPLALFVLWVGASALWAGDATEAAVDLFFFVLPFGLLALLVARLPWRDGAPLWLLRLLVAMALVFAAVGIGQWATREVFWNEKVMRGNENSVLFRVNSLFWDPSIYGRFLVVAILAILVVILLARRRPRPLAGVLVACFLWVGLVFSFSQSSFAALAAGLALVVLLVWGSRGALGLGLLVLGAVVALLVAPPLEGVRDGLTGSSSRSLDRATRGRADLVANGLRIAAEHPVVGVGIGNFTSAYEERFDVPGRVRTPASHTTPVTVLAETGVVGLGLFAWLVAAALGLGYAARRAERDPPRLTGLVAFVDMAAILVHSLFYSGFLEDPMTWGLVGLGALAARVGVGKARASAGGTPPAGVAGVRGRRERGAPRKRAGRSALPASSGDGRRLNILLLMADQHRWDALGCTGGWVDTPSLDRIAASGLLFRNAYTNAPVCVPARVSLALGRYPHNHNVRLNKTYTLDRKRPTWMRRIHKSGYATSVFGKTHLHPHEGDLRANYDLVRAWGFDHVEEIAGPRASLVTEFDLKDRWREAGVYDAYRQDLKDRFQNRAWLVRPSPLPLPLYPDVYVARQAAAYLRDFDGPQPWFCWVSFSGPHEPYDAPEPYASRYSPDAMPPPIPPLQDAHERPPGLLDGRETIPFESGEVASLRAGYAGKVSLIDDQVGELLRVVEERGEWDRTVVAFVSDHGEMNGDYGLLKKGNFLNPAVRVPFLLRVPETSAGATADGLVELMDLGATLAELAGATQPRRSLARSVVPLLERPSARHRRGVLAEVRRETMYATRNWKIALNDAGKPYLLFNLRRDPEEGRNLAGLRRYRLVEWALVRAAKHRVAAAR